MQSYVPQHRFWSKHVGCWDFLRRSSDKHFIVFPWIPIDSQREGYKSIVPPRKIFDPKKYFLIFFFKFFQKNFEKFSEKNRKFQKVPK